MEDPSPMARLSLLFGASLTDRLLLVPSSSSPARVAYLYTLKTEGGPPVGFADVEEEALVFYDLDGAEVWRAIARQGGSFVVLYCVRTSK
jgi:hypothetical protein